MKTDSNGFLATLALTNIVMWFCVVVLFAQVPNPLPNEDPRTFVFVWSEQKEIEGASVYVERRQTDSTAPVRFSFPKTNEGGWTKRQIPDGDYTLFVDAEGYRSYSEHIVVPSGKRYKFRDYKVILVWKD